jgi:uncharacterized 2Fe-2S/4Fe-4S cluster protein (DUF4445 family)
MPTTSEALEVECSVLGLRCHREARLIVAPGLSAYVGADIVADLLAAGLTTREPLALLIDIGTNGEMVLGNSEQLVACSTAAGPAFEGANIRCGSGAIAGAINTVHRSGPGIEIGTIGALPPRSICGPGLVDLLALLLEDGIVDETGRLDADTAKGNPVYADRMTRVEDEPAIFIVDGSAGPIVLTQGDIRQVQLAKGAIAAGVRTLLADAGKSAEQVTAVYLAGGFGSYLNPESAARIGLLPGLDSGKVTAIGNAAGSGAARIMLDSSALGEACRMVEEGRYLELSRSDAFQEFFMEEMLFA